MKKITHIDKSYVVATILATKDKYYNEAFCTFKECNEVANVLRKEIYNAVISNNIDDHYYKMCRDVIVLKEDFDLFDIKMRFQGYLPFNILKILWDDVFIYKILEEQRKLSKEKLNFAPSDLGEIIEKIVNNPSQFYQKIAGELSNEEFLFISSLINEKSCSNCNNLSCRIPSDDKPIDNCVEWSNPELIGKMKLLRKY